MKILEKIKNNLGNETIGTVDETVSIEVEPKRVKEQKEVNKKTVKTEKKKIVVPKSEEVEEVKAPMSVTFGSQYNVSYILEDLKIRENTDISGLVSEDFIRDVTFDEVVPKGIDPHQMNRFCDLVERDIYRYRQLIASRDRDVKVIAEETARLLNQIKAEKEKSELANFMNQQKTQEQELRDTVLDLRMENAELKRELERMKKQVIMQQAQQLQSEKEVGLPVLNNSKDFNFNETEDETIAVEEEQYNFSKMLNEFDL